MNIQNYLNPDAKIIDNYTLFDLRDKDDITVRADLTTKEIDNLGYLKDGMNITIKSEAITDNDEINYCKNIKKIIERLGTSHRLYYLTIKINNREIFRQSNILENIPDNITLAINNNNYLYDTGEYNFEEIKLESLISKIRNANLSPLEKYLAAYDVVKHYRPYKEDKSNASRSRQLKYILKDDNDYIVCVGFARLLSELLNRIGIPNKYIHVDVDKSYDNTDEHDVINVSHVGHARNLIKIDDDKYNIHGIYLADATKDSNQEANVYLHSLMTFDRLKEARLLEKLNDIDLLYDFHNLDEFEKKLSYYIKKEKRKFEKTDNYDEKRIYKELYLNIMKILKDLDQNEFKILYDKYNRSLCDKADELSIEELKRITTNFTVEYYHHIINLTNNEIPIKDIFIAAATAKKELNGLSNEELNEWLRKTIDDYNERKDDKFPYIYNPNEHKEAFLSERKKRG